MIKQNPPSLALLPSMHRLPIPSIRRHDPMGPKPIPIQTPPIDTISFGETPRDIERTDAARLAEPMLRRARVEAVFRQVVFSVEAFELGGGDLEAEETLMVVNLLSFGGGGKGSMCD